MEELILGIFILVLMVNGTESLSDCNWTRTQNHLVRKRILNQLAKLTKWLSCVLSTYLYGAFDFMFLSCHERISEWIHTIVVWIPRNSLLNNLVSLAKWTQNHLVSKWTLNHLDEMTKWLSCVLSIYLYGAFDWTWTQNHLVRKRILNHLGILTKWLSCVLRTYLYGAFEYIILSCHVRVSEWIHSL